MSFRRRLTLFFILIVVLPMVVMTVLVARLSGESRTGKADARLSAGLDAALSVYADNLERSRRAARQAARNEALIGVLRGRKTAPVEEVVRRLEKELGVAFLAVLGPGGRGLAARGSGESLAESRVTVRAPTRELGAVSAATLTAAGYARRVQDVTGRDAAVIIDGRPAASTIELGGEELPTSDAATTIGLPTGEVRVAAVPLRGAQPHTELAMFGPIDAAGLTTTEPVIVIGLLAFFGIALAFVVILVRSLQGQIAAMLAAANRIGGGDFSRAVPVEGDDEMAGLAREFNKMSDRLSKQMGELRRQRAELERSIRRIGEAFAHGLDREALLDIVAETGLAACEADTCRIVLAGRTKEQAEAGMVAEGDVADTLRAAEHTALEEGGETDVRKGEVHALAEGLAGVHNRHRRLGVMSIARRATPFGSGQRELFRYLVGQASISVENLDLHELVSEQAITDELTGLSNQRRFRELIGKEGARAERFGHELSLVMLDIDDFKQVNDAHGHLQGDEVLRTLGRILLEESRGVDEPARYGGEEFVVALPETGPAGAVEVAERIRERVETAVIPRVDGSGTLRVTASLGVASMPDVAPDASGLIAAADAALYRAKAAGKNRAVQAPASEEPSWSIAAQGQTTERRT